MSTDLFKEGILTPFSTTGIGSLPHLDPEEAAGLVIESFDIPFWPQLPKLSFKELMIPQYSEGMPSIKIDAEKQDIRIERNEEEIERFYEGVSGDARVAISEEYAKGLYAFLKKLNGRRFKILKGHITGPLTFSLGLKASDGKPLYFDEELREISLMLLQAKARWQIDILSPYAEKVLIFIDEPILSALGSTSYMGVSEEEALRLLRETSEAIKAAGGVSGIHCCGRADWSLVMKTGVDVMNFDAYEFGDTLGIYPEELRAFLDNGNLLAWGIVPTTEAINNETEDSIKRLFNNRIETLSKHIPEELLLKNIILTPSCGTGSRTVPESLKVFQILMRLKEELSV
jgi:hypothetical protein